MFRHALLVAGMLGAIGIAATAQRFASPQRLYTIEETERLVKADVAALANVDADDVHVAARAERTWPDSRLGCGSGLGLGRSAVDGYAFTVKSAKGHFEYHTNRFGDVQRCRTVRSLAP
jgi:hypothetical protein